LAKCEGAPKPVMELVLYFLKIQEGSPVKIQEPPLKKRNTKKKKNRKLL
jgi:hypothetical protein